LHTTFVFGPKGTHMLWCALLVAAAVPRVELELMMTDDGRWATSLMHAEDAGPHRETHLLSFTALKQPIARRVVVLWGDTAARVPFGLDGLELSAGSLVGAEWSVCDRVFRNTPMLRYTPCPFWSMLRVRFGLGLCCQVPIDGLVSRYCYTGDPVATGLKCSLETGKCIGDAVDFDFNATRHQVPELGEIRSGPLDAVVAYANPNNAVMGTRTIVAFKQAPNLRIVVENGIGAVYRPTDNVDTVASLVLLLVIVVVLLNLTHVDRYACEECYAGFSSPEALEHHCAEHRVPPEQGRLARWFRLPCDRGGQHMGLVFLC